MAGDPWVRFPSLSSVLACIGRVSSSNVLALIVASDADTGWATGTGYWVRLWRHVCLEGEVWFTVPPEFNIMYMMYLMTSHAMVGGDDAHDSVLDAGSIP